MALVITVFGFVDSPDKFVAAASNSPRPPSRPRHAPADSWIDFVSVCGLFVFAYAGLGAGPALGGETRTPKRKCRSASIAAGRSRCCCSRRRRGAVPRRAVVGGDRPYQGRQGQLCDRAGTCRAGRAEMADGGAQPRGRADRRQDAGAGADGRFALLLRPGARSSAAAGPCRSVAPQGAARPRSAGRGAGLAVPRPVGVSSAGRWGSQCARWRCLACGWRWRSARSTCAATRRRATPNGPGRSGA